VVTVVAVTARASSASWPDLLTDELLTVAQLAAILKVNHQTVRNWIDAGRIPHVRVGERRVRVYRSDFQVFIRAGEPESRRAEPEPEGTIWDGLTPPPRMP
jgi:excisionase family DNA binding protein